MLGQIGDSDTLEDLINMAISYANTRGLRCDTMTFQINRNDDAPVIAWLVDERTEEEDEDTAYYAIVEVPGHDYSQGFLTLREAAVAILRALVETSEDDEPTVENPKPDVEWN